MGLNPLGLGVEDADDALLFFFFLKNCMFSSSQSVIQTLQCTLIYINNSHLFLTKKKNCWQPECDNVIYFFKT